MKNEIEKKQLKVIVIGNFYKNWLRTYLILIMNRESKKNAQNLSTNIITKQ